MEEVFSTAADLEFILARAQAETRGRPLLSPAMAALNRHQTEKQQGDDAGRAKAAY
jgi:hypothetical protein